MAAEKSSVVWRDDCREAEEDLHVNTKNSDIYTCVCVCVAQCAKSVHPENHFEIQNSPAGPILNCFFMRASSNTTFLSPESWRQSWRLMHSGCTQPSLIHFTQEPETKGGWRLISSHRCFRSGFFFRNDSFQNVFRKKKTFDLNLRQNLMSITMKDDASRPAAVSSWNWWSQTPHVQLILKPQKNSWKKHSVQNKCWFRIKVDLFSSTQGLKITTSLFPLRRLLWFGQFSS